jgi:hypothetical protein
MSSMQPEPGCRRAVAALAVLRRGRAVARGHRLAGRGLADAEYGMARRADWAECGVGRSAARRQSAAHRHGTDRAVCGAEREAVEVECNVGSNEMRDGGGRDRGSRT